MDERPEGATTVAVSGDACRFERELADSLETHRVAVADEREPVFHFVSLQVQETG